MSGNDWLILAALVIGFMAGYIMGRQDGFHDGYGRRD